jgi:hypothetical protein
MMDEAMLARLRELVEAGKAGGWQEVGAALDMGDIVLALRGDRGAIKAAVEVTGLSAATLWRRAKLAEHRAEIEAAKPANLTEALKLVKALEAAAGEEEVEEAKPKRGRPKRDPLEVLKEQLHATASKLAMSGAVPVEEAVAIVREVYEGVAVPSASPAKKPAKPEASPEEAELMGLIGKLMKKDREASTKPPANGPQGAVSQPPASTNSFTSETKNLDEPLDLTFGGPLRALVLRERWPEVEVRAGTFTKLKIEERRLYTDLKREGLW